MAMKEVALKNHTSNLIEQGAAKSIDKGLKSVSKKRKMERSKIEIHPGKKGGQYNLVDGLKVTVSENTFVGKKDSISGIVVPPNKRSDYCPILREQEKLISEMVVLVAKPQLCQPLQIQMRHLVKFEPTNYMIRVMRHDADDVFTEISYSKLENGWVHFATTTSGVFFLLSCPKYEKIEVNPDGGLYNLKVHPLMSIRIPKRSYDGTSTCDISILPIHEERIAQCRNMNFVGSADVVNISPFFSIDFPEVELRRAATLKLPLPDWALENIKKEKIVVMQYQQGQWNVVQSELKFTKTSVTFDVKILSRYCIIQLSDTAGGSVRAKQAMALFDDFNRKVCGEILAFVQLEEHKWHLWIEFVQLQQVEEVITDRVKCKGFTLLNKMEDPNNTTQVAQDNKRVKDHPSNGIQEQSHRGHHHVANGSVFHVGLQGEFSICGTQQANKSSAEKVHPSNGIMKVADSSTEKLQFELHEEFADNYHRFEIEPTASAQTRAKQLFEKSATSRFDTDLEVFTGRIICEVQSSKQSEDLGPVASFNLEIDFEDLKEYLNLRAIETASVKEAEKKVEIEQQQKQQPIIGKGEDDKIPLPLPVPLKKSLSSSSFARLTKQKSNTIQLIKESKVLSGRSLQNLSKNLNQGLTLAVHLNLPDSIITGIGFDALSTGCSLTEVTYKILMHWKRTEKDKSKLVPMLVEALKVMGRTDLAAIVEDRDKQNVELSADCFQL